MSDEKTESPQGNQKTVEKYYIEVNPSGFRKFFHGLLGGLGWGIGLTVGTAVILAVLGYFASRVDFVPIFGQFLTDVIKTTQGNLSK